MKYYGHALVLAVGSLLAIAQPSHAYVYSTCGQWGSWSSGMYTVLADEWGASSGQCLYVNSAGNWTSTSNFSGGGIKAYPDTQIYVNQQMSSLSAINTSFNFSAPGGANYDWAYDCWTQNNADEIMIWEQWNGNGPIASSYSCGGACPLYSNVSIDGASWNVYQGSNGSNNVVSFLRNGQTSSGNQNALAFYSFCAAHGLLHNQTVSYVDFGVEITSTSGTQNFTLNSYSASVSTGSSGGGGGSYSSGISNGNHTLTPQNATGSRLDASGSGTSNNTNVQIWQANGAANQSWNFTNIGGGIYNVKASYDTALCLDVYGASSSNGANVELWSCNGGNNQKWGAISDGGSVYELAPQNATGSRLDVSGNGTSNGTNVQIWQATGAGNQKWAVN
jgi:hypothetical protein